MCQMPFKMKKPNLQKEPPPPTVCWQLGSSDLGSLASVLTSTEVAKSIFASEPWSLFLLDNLDLQKAQEGWWRERLHDYSAVSSDSHLEVSHRWSGQHHLDCFWYSWSSAPWLICFHFFEANPWNCGCLCHGYSLVIMAVTCPPSCGFRICKTSP